MFIIYINIKHVYERVSMIQWILYSYVELSK